MIYLVNAFSINMLPDDIIHTFRFVPMPAHTVREMLISEPWQSAIGHPDTARMVSNELGIEVPVNRISLSLEPNDELIVAQYTGPRLEAGSSSLPPGATLRFWLANCV